MSQRIIRVAPGSAGKIFGAMYFLLGFLFAPVLGLRALLSGESSGGSLIWILFLPVLYGVFGFLSTAFFAWIYNLLAARIGGLEVEIVTVAEPSVGPGL